MFNTVAIKSEWVAKYIFVLKDGKIFFFVFNVDATKIT